MFRKSVAALAAVAFIASPVLAQASSAPVAAVQRAGPAAGDSSQLAGGPILPPILAATIIILGILMATGVVFDNDDSDPVSP
jgi:hypothetical protein